MGPMLRATTRRHPPDRLIHAIRAALLSTIQAKRPEVLDDLRDAVFTPLIHSMTRDDIVAILIVDRGAGHTGMMGLRRLSQNTRSSFEFFARLVWKARSRR